MNENVPYIWRKNYRNEAASPEELLEIAHEKARQYLSHAVEINDSSQRARGRSWPKFGQMIR